MWACVCIEAVRRSVIHCIGSEEGGPPSKHISHPTNKFSFFRHHRFLQQIRETVSYCSCRDMLIYHVCLRVQLPFLLELKIFLEMQQVSMPSFFHIQFLKMVRGRGAEECLPLLAPLDFRSGESLWKRSDIVIENSVLAGPYAAHL